MYVHDVPRSSTDPRLLQRPALSVWRIIETRTTEMVLIELGKMQIIVQNEKKTSSAALSNEKIIYVIWSSAAVHVPGGGYV